MIHATWYYSHCWGWPAASPGALLEHTRPFRMEQPPPASTRKLLIRRSTCTSKLFRACIWALASCHSLTNSVCVGGKCKHICCAQPSGIQGATDKWRGQSFHRIFKQPLNCLHSRGQDNSCAVPAASALDCSFPDSYKGKACRAGVRLCRRRNSGLKPVSHPEGAALWPHFHGQQICQHRLDF